MSINQSDHLSAQVVAQAKVFDTTSAPENGNGWIEQTPLQRQVDPAEPYPIEALGAALEGATRATRAVIQAPDAVTGQSFLAVATLAAQGLADVSIDGRTVPISEFFVSIAESGERKSATDNVALYPAMRFQKSLREAHDAERLEYVNSKSAYDKGREEALNKKNQTVKDKEDALKALGEPPMPPLEPIFVFQDPTIEGITKLLASGRASQGLFSDEGGGVIGGHGMNADNLLKTASGLSSLWDGKPFIRTRAGDGVTALYGRRLSMHLMMQPVVSAQMFSNAVLTQQGFMSRVLACFPQSTAGTRLYQECDISASKEIRTYNAVMAQLFERKLSVKDGARNELEPRKLLLSTGAKRLYMQFHDTVEKNLGEAELFATIRGFANKAPEHAVRLAATLAIIENADAEEVTDEHMLAGAKLAEYYLNEALRLQSASCLDPELALAQSLADWLQARGKQFISLVEIYRYGPNRVRDARTAQKLLGILYAHGHVRPHQGSVEFEGVQRRSAWEVRAHAKV